MKGSEAERRLKKSGWTFLRRTAGGHDIWRSPEGETQMLGLNHSRNLNRNTVADVRRAQRTATLHDHRKDLLMTTSVDQVEKAAKAALSVELPDLGEATAAPEAATMRVYRSAGSKPFVEVLYNEVIARHLKSPEMVRIYQDGSGVWRLKAGGEIRVRCERLRSGQHLYRVASRMLGGLLPATGRTVMPVDVVDGGVVLHPELVKAVKPRLTGTALGIRRKAAATGDGLTATLATAMASQTASKARQASTASSGPKIAANPFLPAGGASTAQQTASQRDGLVELVGGTITAPTVPHQFLNLPSKKAASIDDLKTALELLRGTLTELGAVLHTPDGKVIDLSRVDAVMRVTL